ncbi:MAG: hypothetical protein AAB505_00795 [Patescibacteria group bacterium]
MTWLEQIDKLRTKPEPVRRRITLALASGLTLALALLWVVNFRYTAPLAENRLAPAALVAAPTAEKFLTGWERVKTGWQVLLTKLKPKQQVNP